MIGVVKKVKQVALGSQEDQTPNVVFEDGDDAVLAMGFVQIPVAIIKNPGISAQAKVVYGLLLTYAWNGSCFPRGQTMADQLGWSLITIKRALYELRDKDLIEIHNRKPAPNLYVIKKITVGWYRQIATSVSQDEREMPEDQRIKSDTLENSDVSVKRVREEKPETNTSQGLKHSTGTNLSVDNGKIIGEITTRFRAIPGWREQPSDFGRVGTLYNQYGADIVIRSIQGVSWKIAKLTGAEREAFDPLSYVRAICERLYQEEQAQAAKVGGQQSLELYPDLSDQVDEIEHMRRQRR